MIEKIPRAELKVMMLFWDTDKVLTSRDIVNIMSEEWKQTTTLTLLSRLSKRGFLEPTKKPTYTTYKILIDKKSYLEFATSDFVKNVHNDSIVSLVDSVNKEKIGKDELASLRAFIKKLKK
ncbi:BlaI/MecI/CopY family transcriptional regulator [Clostridioides difficile]|uniref:BlaI/MecI/CopY family transcriptional regulator n=1 Tax=Clostridioides difficile TaxID=1496 RepID=UPI0030463F81|nr:BlaI/MecI/CopY family transcriptional regulator [Clostridioides difficile]